MHPGVEGLTHVNHLVGARSCLKASATSSNSVLTAAQAIGTISSISQMRTQRLREHNVP